MNRDCHLALVTVNVTDALLNQREKRIGVDEQGCFFLHDISNL